MQRSSGAGLIIGLGAAVAALPGTRASGEGPIGQARTGAVALMKGRNWPSRVRPLLHRSPRASRARPRWVLAIDPVEPRRAPG